MVLLALCKFLVMPLILLLVAHLALGRYGREIAVISHICLDLLLESKGYRERE